MDDVILTLEKSLSSNEQKSVSSVIRSLEESDFFEHLTIDDSASGFVLKAWNYVRSNRELYLSDPELANFAPYGLSRVEAKLNELFRSWSRLTDQKNVNSSKFAYV